MYIVREIDPLAIGDKEVVDIKDALLEKKAELCWDDIFDKMDRPEEYKKINMISTTAEQSKFNILFNYIKYITYHHRRRLQLQVLGPFLFNIYFILLFSLFEFFPALSFHTYADDIQLYINDQKPLHLFLNYIQIHTWLQSNSIRLNPTKFEDIFLKITLHYSYVIPPPINIHKHSA